MNNFDKRHSSFDKQHNSIALMVKIIFGVVITLMLAMFIGYGYIAYKAVDTISDNGGVEATIIKVGKQVKHISAAINEEE